MPCLLGVAFYSQQINRINAFFRKARRFGLCSPTCLCDVSKYLRLVDSRLLNRIQGPPYCFSPLLPPKKHDLGLRPRGHSYTLPMSK